MQPEKTAHMDALAELLAEMDDPRQVKLFLRDLCTVRELENMAERCYAAKLLLEGKTYSQVMELADISSATLSRVSRCVRYGSGYAAQLKK